MAKITDAQMQVLINIIGAVETGGQIYGKRRYNDYTNAYTNSSAEDSITIGAFQEFKNYAKALLQDIKDQYPNVFAKYDNAGLASDLKKSSWSGYNPSKTSAKAKAIVNIISSKEGKKVQDQRIVKLLNQYIAYAETLGITEIDALFEAANFVHQGGNSALKRIVQKTKKPYTLDNLYAACKTDTGNQVGAYKTRQKKVYQWLKEYLPKASASNSTTTTAKKKETTTSGKLNTTVKWTGQVTADELNVRTWAGTENKTCSFSPLKKGTKIGVCDSVKASNGDVWYYIKYNGKYGFVHSGWVKKITSTTTTTTKKITTTTKKKTTTTTKKITTTTKKETGKYSRSAVVNLINSWIGKNEADGSYKSIIDIYNSYTGKFPRGTKMKYEWAWCACTWSALAIKLGYTAIMPIEISCYYIIERAKEMGVWVEQDSYVPSPGDAVIYDWEDNGAGDNTGAPDHIGTVTEVHKDQGYFIVVEGNYSNSVKQRKLSINGRYIRGFITPKYDATGTITPTTTKKSTSTSGTLNTVAKWTGKVTADSLNVRTWAGTENKTCSFSPLTEGTKVSVCDSVKANNGDTWYYIKYNGKYGFVHSAYIAKV